MERIHATRSELLAKRTQIALARQGRELLEQKRNALLQELMRTAEQALRDSGDLEQSAGQSAAALSLAQAIDGPEAVLSASFAARGEIALDMSVTSVMGVRVPIIERRSASRGPLDRGYSLSGVSARIDAVADAFEGQLDLIIELAMSELRLRRLAQEINRATRRVNALEHVLIPRLEKERVYIEMVLQERERENLFRLKRVKTRLQRTPTSVAVDPSQR